VTILYRCSSFSNLSGRESYKFLQSAGEKASVSPYLNLSDSIQRIFNRPMITKEHQSRFGPVGYARNPLYVANDIDTTFYEYGFHLLNKKDEFKDATEFRITCFELDCNATLGTLYDPSLEKNASKIINPSTDYSAAHKWFRNLRPEPDIIKYPSVRHPSPELPSSGINYAIYEKRSVLKAYVTDQLIMVLNKKKDEVTVYDLQFQERVSLLPKMK